MKIKKQRKYLRCPHLNKNVWVELETDKDVEGNELLISMTCMIRDKEERTGKTCGTECKNYFFSDD